MADEDFMKLLEETENLATQLEQKYNITPDSDLEETLAADSLDAEDSIDASTLEPAAE
jgi:acyl carrier protein